MTSESILFAVFAAFTAAVVAGEVAERLGQPAVVGELLAGIALGPSLLGWIPVAGQRGDALEVLAQLGAVVLLFQVGLETSPSDLRAQSGPAATTALLGIAFPFAGGYGVAVAFGKRPLEAAFLATALVATSVGITARVLRDLGRLGSRASRVTLGAAVIDDALGLLILTVVVSLGTSSLTVGRGAVLIAEALLFVVALFAAGPPIAARLSHLLEAPRIRRAPFAIALTLLLGLSVSAQRFGLAAIVGAFLAGTILSGTSERYGLAHQIEPVADLLAPLFFVITGAQVDVGSFARGGILGLAAAATAVAIVGKLAGGMIGARSLGRADALMVGTGMIPRGEVGMIVAGLALKEGVVDRDLFGVVMLVVVLTTLAAPPALRHLYARAS